MSGFRERLDYFYRLRDDSIEFSTIVRFLTNDSFNYYGYRSFLILFFNLEEIFIITVQGFALLEYKMGF
jgi:hypothetical protein